MRGSFIDDMVFMILSTPILYPTMIKMGFDPLWLGMIIGITFIMGVVLPPMALTSSL
jgi:TRAP-type C4-dicarboxylate transport system permease large subunit